MPESRPSVAGVRGRPRGTSARELELIALRLFTNRGFEQTAVEQIAAEAGVSRRTFFRYFENKAAVLWHGFDQEVANLRIALAAVPPDVAVIDGIRAAVVSVNHYSADDVAELRARIGLLSSVPALAADASTHYWAWEGAVIDFAAGRLAQPADALLPVAIGRATLAVCRAAYETWVGRADADLQKYLDEAIAAMGRGFRP